MDFKHCLKYRTSRKIRGYCFTGLLEDFYTIRVAERGGVGGCSTPSVTRLQRCCEKCCFPEQAKRSASLLSVLFLLYGGKEMVGEGFLMLSAILVLLAVWVRFGERTPCAVPFQRTCAVQSIICLLRSTPLEALRKQVGKLLSAFSSAWAAQLCNSLETLLS